MFNRAQFIKKLTALQTRQGETARRAGMLIQKELKRAGIPFLVEQFSVSVPVTKKAELVVDRRSIPCEGTSFTGGTISGKDALISSLIPSRYSISLPNINFNPRSRVISRSNFYFAPAVAIARADIPKVLAGKRVKGSVAVRASRERAEHIMVGNTKNPKKVFFAHYDSIGPGGIDNASGAACLLETLISKPESVRSCLYVFDGNEELSYDYPTYWGHGFRVFEKKYFALMDRARAIIVVDSVGNGPAHKMKDTNITYLAFPIANYKRWRNKISIIGGDIDGLLSVYHSPADDGSALSPRFLDSATRLIARETP